MSEAESAVLDGRFRRHPCTYSFEPQSDIVDITMDLRWASTTSLCGYVLTCGRLFECVVGRLSQAQIFFAVIQHWTVFVAAVNASQTRGALQ